MPPKILTLLVFFTFYFRAIGQSTLDFDALNGPYGLTAVIDMATGVDGTLFLLNESGIYKSEDNGQTWALCMEGIPPANIYSGRFFRSPQDQLFFWLSSTLYQFQAPLNRWQSFTLPWMGTSVAISFDTKGRIWAAPKYPYQGLIYYATDSADTFTPFALPVNNSNGPAAIAAYNDEHNLAYFNIGRPQLFHFSLNGALQEVLANTYIKWLEYNPYSGTAFFETDLALMRSENGGLTWAKTELLPGQPYKRVGKLIFDKTGTTWAFTDEGAYQSNDQGKTWKKDAVLSRVKGAFLHTDNDMWFVGNQCGYQGPTLARSRDGGANWDELDGAFALPTSQQILTDKLGTLYVYTCSKGGFKKSDDGGQYWADLVIPDSVPTYARNLAINSNDVMVAVGVNNNVYRSEDHGNTWQRLRNLPANPDKTSFLGLFAGANPVFYLFNIYNPVISLQSTDDGRTWHPINLKINSLHGASVHPNGDLFMVDAGHIKVYIKQADTTKVIKEGIDWQKYTNVYCAPNGNTYVGYLDQEDFTDVITQLYVIYPNGQYKLGGAISTRHSALLFKPIVANSKGDIFTYEGGDLVTYDGASWKTLRTSLPLKGRSHLHIGSDQHLYATFSADVVHRSKDPVTATNYLTGNVWMDQNPNCLLDSGDSNLPTTMVSAESDGGVYVTLSGGDGHYTLSVPPGTFKVNAHVPNALFAPCQTNVSLDLQTAGTTKTLDFPLKPTQSCPYLEVHFSTPIQRVCRKHSYLIRYQNLGTAPAPKAYLEVFLDSFLLPEKASIPYTQDGQKLRFEVGDLVPGQVGHINLEVKLACSATTGQAHCVGAEIFPHPVCSPELPARFRYTECQRNVGPYDPNDKRAFVEGEETPSHVKPNTDIEYVIRFQNTGTDTAFRVVVEDRLSTLLDLTSLTPLIGSHPYKMEIHDQRVLRFVFDNIHLPDSNTNWEASQGFVKFRISQAPDVRLGSAIRNTADIYFDFNTPIKTPPSVLYVGATSKVDQIPKMKYAVNAYPNPFGHFITFEVVGQDVPPAATLRLFDPLGRPVREEVFRENQCVIERKGLAAGLYFYLIQANGIKIAVGRIMAVTVDGG